MDVYRLVERSRGSGLQRKHCSTGQGGRCLGAQGQFPIVGGMALIIALAAFSLALFNMPDENVVQLIAGDNITLSPDNGYGGVTITSTGGNGAPWENENNVTKIIAGENITISPENGYGDVTITAAGNGTAVENENNVTQLIGSENVLISPENGYGGVTINVENIGYVGSIVVDEAELTHNYILAYNSVTGMLEYINLAEMTDLVDWIVAKETIVTTTVDYVEWTGLNGDLAGSYELFISLKNALGLAKDLLIYVNGDYTNSNYYSQWMGASGTGHAVITANRYNVPYVMGVYASEGGTAEVSIRRDGDNMFRADSFSNWGSGSNTRIYIRTISKTATISNITSIRIAGSASGVIGAGSTFRLCRIRALG